MHLDFKMADDCTKMAQDGWKVAYNNPQRLRRTLTCLGSFGVRPAKTPSGLRMVPGGFKNAQENPNMVPR